VCPEYRLVVDNRVAWESEAQSWLRWARQPGHDAYWQFRYAFFAIVPTAGRLTLDVGCGEGRVARDLIARGHTVAAFDGSPTLVRSAADADHRGRYCVGDAAHIPFQAGSFDIAVAYNCLMDVDDMSGAVHEIARVLSPGSALCICVPHPFVDAGAFESEAENAPYRLTEPYLESRAFDGIEECDGLSMHFTGWSHTLEEYVSVLASAGFVIDALREPRPESSTGRYARWHRLPMFLNLRAIKR
jgi:ubiquinone/menaquinone biosynthesis C-methylase UbiE